VVDFEDVVATNFGLFNLGQVPGPLTDETSAHGVTFAGVGPSGGALAEFIDAGFVIPILGASPPNVLVFSSGFIMQNGGIVRSPETLSFNPPVTSLQFNTMTFSPCAASGSAQQLRIEGFAPGGGSFGGTTVSLRDPQDLPGGADLGGQTLAFTFPPPGAERVVVSSAQLCSGIFESWGMDNVAFVAIFPPSKCAKAQLKAAGDYAKAQTKCHAKASLLGQPVDSLCLESAQTKFAKAFAKAANAGDCPTPEDAAATGASVADFVGDVVAAITGGAAGPDVCDGMKIKAAGTKASNVSKCYSKAVNAGAAPDVDCVTKAAATFNKILKKCGTPEQLAPVEALIDTFANRLSRTLAVATTTTTTTTTTSTTTTTIPPLGQHVRVTTAVGTAACGTAPFSGALFSDTAATTKVADLGLGCLFIGGGNGSTPASITPENATTILDSPDGMALVASFGTGPRDCSRGPASTRHCVQVPGVECTSDADCGGIAGACQFDPNCFFGPPVPVGGSLPTCVVNTLAADASGTIDLATGASSTNIQLKSQVYFSLGLGSPCPKCEAGACSYGANAGGACTTSNSAGTTVDCLPSLGTFLSTLSVDLSPLTTETITATAADGNFCPGQAHLGAFARAEARAIQQAGVAAGDLTDGLPHPTVQVSNFCIPATGNGAVDIVADLPGPGSLSLPATAQLVTP
jgi:hypothetical protein